MSSSQTSRLPGTPGAKAVRPTDAHLLSLGKLHYLAAYCPLHRKYPAEGLARLFIPAVNAGCVRFFEDANGATAAALIWARLSDEVSRRMVYESIPPGPADWTSGDTLWFLDLIAPFGHGLQVARHIARHPPNERFFFARLGLGGTVRKVVEGDATRGRRGLVKAILPETEAA